MTDDSGQTSGLYLGLISGTSADGIDAALVRFASDDAHARCELVHGHTYRWDDALRTRLVALGQGGDCRSLDELGTLDVRIAEAFADAAAQLLDAAGGTMAHGLAMRAERTGIATVADFRRR